MQTCIADVARFFIFFGFAVPCRSVPPRLGLSAGVSRIGAGFWTRRFADRSPPVHGRAQGFAVHRGLLARNPPQIQVIIHRRAYEASFDFGRG